MGLTHFYSFCPKNVGFQLYSRQSIGFVQETRFWDKSAPKNSLWTKNTRVNLSVLYVFWTKAMNWREIELKINFFGAKTVKISNLFFFYFQASFYGVNRLETIFDSIFGPPLTQSMITSVSEKNSVSKIEALSYEDRSARMNQTIENN